VLVYGVGRTVDVEQIGKIVVASQGGVPIRIRDVGEVVIGHEIRKGAVTSGGEGEVVLGLGFMLMGENSYAVTTRLRDRFEKLLDTLPEGVEAKVVYGFFPANAVGDDIVFFDDESRTMPLMTWHGLRQQQERPAGKPHQCLSDFVAPKSVRKVGDGDTVTKTTIPDYAGAFAVSAGIGIEKKLAEFAMQHDDYRAILLKSLADRLAEAAAEWLHAQVRRDAWGYAADEALAFDEMIAEKYRGIRPAPGYPACPDHTVKAALFQLLDAPANADMELTENFAMTPAASVAGFYLAHPEAKYFAVGKIGRDQLEDWAQRSGMPVSEAERWLAPLL